MSKTSLPTAKAHLRVTASDEDSLIGLYVDAAEEHAEKWSDREFGTPLPYSVTAAVLLIVGGLYENRESLVPTQLNANPAVEALLQPFRSYAGFFGNATMPPASALLDNDPINIGDDWSRVWRWKNEDGTAINVTGYTGTFELFDGETSVHSGALTVSDAVNGEFTFSISETVSAALLAQEYWYRVRVVSPGGETTTIDRKRVYAQ